MGFFNFFKRDISEEEFQEQQKVKRGLEKTRTGFFQSIVNTLTNAQIDDDLYDQLEEQLILADVGPACAVRLVDELHDEVKEKHLKTGQEALDALRGIICQELTPRYPMDLDGKPAVILVIGVNGVGKTTTIAKLAGLYKKQGRRVMLAAGDTFRAAASEQLELWAERAGVPLVQAGMGADPAAVIFDAVKSANARGYDMVIADEALMEKFFEGEAFTTEEIVQGMASGVRSGQITPVFCGSAVNAQALDMLLYNMNVLLPGADTASAVGESGGGDHRRPRRPAVRLRL